MTVYWISNPPDTVFLVGTKCCRLVSDHETSIGVYTASRSVRQYSLDQELISYRYCRVNCPMPAKMSGRNVRKGNCPVEDIRREYAQGEHLAPVTLPTPPHNAYTRRPRLVFPQHGRRVNVGWNIQERIHERVQLQPRCSDVERSLSTVNRSIVENAILYAVRSAILTTAGFLVFYDRSVSYNAKYRPELLLNRSFHSASGSSLCRALYYSYRPSKSVRPSVCLSHAGTVPK